jgi:hypothetical protein
MPNTQLFQKIDERLDEDEMLLEMSTWEDTGPVCGTTRCVAGWAIHEVTGQPLYIGGQRNPAIAELAESLGVDDDFEAIGAKLLDLGKGTAAILFFSPNDRARDVVKLFAQGRNDDAFLRLNRD